jgi:hypothetical protein
MGGFSKVGGGVPVWVPAPRLNFYGRSCVSAQEKIEVMHVRFNYEKIVGKFLGKVGRAEHRIQI